MTAPVSEFFDDQLVTLIAKGLPALPHPDGTPLSFPAHVDTFPGDTEEEQAAKHAMNITIAEAFLNYLQSQEHSIVSNALLAQPQQFGEHTIVTIHCATCAAVMFTATMSRDGKISMPPRAIDPTCPLHGADR
ncbi:hypothetical protein [Mycobacterium sp. SMC-4]|uniref:hypothetical protein n=1 Tax=Mycobacterium sp. SMC-4 TaxID=2857059 RepID=UPI0021B42C48|nr:hypothetical protein [Mycobacterium sp. SMC-4]UXA19546.1 hypothetical protein KXD98_08090 [Mycobacterium sp. SMC-4]